MTTQNTHHEHSDVDTPVVEYSSVSKMTAVEPVTPAEAQEGARQSSSEDTSPTTVVEETKDAQPATTVPEAPPPAATRTTAPSAPLTEEQYASTSPDASALVAPSPSAEVQPEPAPSLEVAPSQETTTMPEPVAKVDAKPDTLAPPETTPVAQTPGEPPAAETRDEVQPLLETKAEDVRPFTDFIAEFRQSEAARLQAEEAFALLHTVEPPQSTILVEQVTEFRIEESTTPPVFQQAATPETPETTEPAKKEEPAAPMIEEPAKEKPRPVSPLLRPPSRLRVPRHNRHQQREEQAAALAAAETSAPASQPEAPTPPVTPATTEPATPVAETPAPAPAKPPRRYRFDRPASAASNGNANGSSPASATRASITPPIIEEAHVPTPPVSESQPPKVLAPEVVPPVEPSPNGATTSTPAMPENSRRRHASKEKEQSVPAPVQLPTPAPEPAPEATLPPVETAEAGPEDLPPLEYSELRKASSRRRRRRGSPSTALPAASTPVTPALPTPPPVVPAPTPAPQQPPLSLPPFQQPTVAASNYSLISGYTLNQMNQGNELSSPFLGPEPSPARGSVLSRDSRTTQRAETQAPRPTTFHTTAQSRSDGGLSTAAVNQLTGALTQAFQTQTDRMVAELRRFSQAPTNVSVSLPPFPSTERVGVFVDVANLLYSARTLRISVNFGKLLDFLRGNRRLVRAQAYCPTSPQPGEEQMFLQAVKGLGYRITTKNYKTFSSGAKKADLDLDLCMDVVRLVDGRAVDCIVLVSGDSDFMPMLDYCSDHGVRVEVAAFDEAMSATLRQSCDLFVNLSMLEDIRG